MLLASSSRSVRNAAISDCVGTTHQATKSAIAAAAAVTPSAQNAVCEVTPANSTVQE